jgi:hypothetical protein
MAAHSSQLLRNAYFSSHSLPLPPLAANRIPTSAYADMQAVRFLRSATSRYCPWCTHSDANFSAEPQLSGANLSRNRSPGARPSASALTGQSCASGEDVGGLRTGGGRFGEEILRFIKKPTEPKPGTHSFGPNVSPSKCHRQASHPG